MDRAQSSAGPGMHVVDGVLMVQVPDDCDDEVYRALHRSILDTVHAYSVRGVLIDVSALRMLDSVGFGLLAATARSATLLGARTAFAGFPPGVVSALVDLDVAFDDILAVREMADGLALLRPAAPAPEDEAGEPEKEAPADRDEPEPGDGPGPEPDAEEPNPEQEMADGHDGDGSD